MDDNAVAPWLARAEEYIRRSKAPNTLKAYQSDWRAFETFCRTHDRSSLPAAAETVAAYIAECAASLKANTVERRLAAISQAHQLAGCPNPIEDKLVRTVMAGIRRAKGTARKGKDPLSPALLRRMFAEQNPDLRGIRDRALLLVGFAGALRRTELVALRSENVRFTEEGLVITIPQSKTDQEGEGQTVGIPYGSHPETCPVRALHAWLESSGVSAGYLFRAIGRWGREVTGTAIGDHQLAKIIKRLAQPGRPRSIRLLRPLASLRPRYFCGRRRRHRTLDHGPDPAQVSQTGAQLHPPRQPVPRQRRRPERVVRVRGCSEQTLSK